MLIGWLLAACEAAADDAASAGVCVSVSLRTETLKATWDSASLRVKTLREIGENRGQC
jgi:hypothetical protein